MHKHNFPLLIFIVYENTHVPRLPQTWRSNLKNGAKIIAESSNEKCVILSYTGTCPEFDDTCKKVIRSYYASQMFEYSYDPTTQHVLYNFIKELSLPPIWNPTCHYRFPQHVREQIKTILLIALRDENGKAYHDEVMFYKLPKEILYVIFRYICH